MPLNSTTLVSLLLWQAFFIKLTLDPLSTMEYLFLISSCAMWTYLLSNFLLVFPDYFVEFCLINVSLLLALMIHLVLIQLFSTSTINYFKVPMCLILCMTFSPLRLLTHSFARDSLSSWRWLTHSYWIGYSNPSTALDWISCLEFCH